MTDFAPKPRKRRLPPKGTPERKAYMQALGKRGGKAGKGQAKNHWSPTEWQALRTMGLRSIHQRIANGIPRLRADRS